MIHDFNQCNDGAYLWCAGFAEGYTQGKAKAHMEVRHQHTSRHSDDCGCAPCSTVRQVRASVRPRLQAAGWLKTGSAG